MTVGAWIFLASLILGTILLFGITKDRWNWTKIIKRFAFGLGGLLVIVVLSVFAWAMVERSKEANANQAATEKLAREREDRARACIADDLPRMEKLAGSIEGAVRDGMKLQDVKTAIDGLTGTAGQILPPNVLPHFRM